MKKIIWVLVATAMSFTACQVDEPTAPSASGNVLSAKIEQTDMTKTSLDANNILWSADDQIVGFMKSSYGYKYQIDPAFAGKTYADFTKVAAQDDDRLSAGTEWNHNVVYYPYSENFKCVKADNGYTLDVELPAEQTYTPGSFANGAFHMVAVSEDNNITFYNVGGALKIQFMGLQQVTSIKVEGKNNEILAGEATVTASADKKPAIKMNSTTATAVTLDCGDGIQLNTNTPVDFIITLPPVEFTNGFTLTVTDSNNEVYTIDAKAGNKIERSKLLVMPNLFLGADPTPPVEDDVNTITIDGDFSDWSALNPAKVYTAINSSDSRYGALKIMKINALNDVINAYIEMDEDLITDRSKIKLTMYINADNNTSSKHDYFLGQTAVDYMCEGTLHFDSYNSSIYAYTGNIEADWGWNWSSALSSSAKVFKGSGNESKYELSIDKAKLAENGININNTFSIGFLLVDGNTNGAIGVLPNGSIDDENRGKAEMLEVTIGSGGNSTTTEDPETLGPEIKSGDRVLATNRNVQKFVEEVTYPDHDYTQTLVRDYYGGYGHNYVAGDPVNSDKPESYTIRWTADYDAGDLTFVLSEPEWSATQTVAAGSEYVEVTNLVPNTHYTYKVTAANGTVMAEGEFDTYGTVRHVFFKANVRNCRDLGGWKTYEGKTVKFHKIYRGGRLESSTLANSGIKAIKAEGIKAQLDIRGNSDVLSAPAIEGFDFCAPIIETGGPTMLTQDGGAKTKQSMPFVIAGLKADKPVYFHCSLGRDRTGTLALIILGLLDVVEGDISKEYELSYFSPKGWSIASSENYSLYQNVRTTWAYQPTAEYIWEYVNEGERFSAGVERYLLEIGITKSDIDTFRSLMLTDAPAN